MIPCEPTPTHRSQHIFNRACMVIHGSPSGSQVFLSASICPDFLLVFAGTGLQTVLSGSACRLAIMTRCRPRGGSRCLKMKECTRSINVICCLAARALELRSWLIAGLLGIRALYSRPLSSWVCLSRSVSLSTSRTCQRRRLLMLNEVAGELLTVFVDA